MSKHNKFFDQGNIEWEAGNFESAFKLFNLAAINGEVYAFNSIGYFHDKGIGTKKNNQDALSWYRRAARFGDICAFSNIGLLYAELGNIRQAKFWLMKAVKSGDGDSALEVAKLYLFKSNLGNKVKAIEYLNFVLTASNTTEDSKDEAHRLLQLIAARER